jgi:hypothetical protein
MDEIQRSRQRADAEGIIREVHLFCEGSCPHREHCPGMACRMYQREMTAKDVLAGLDAPVWDPPTFAGVILEPRIK